MLNLNGQLAFPYQYTSVYKSRLRASHKSHAVFLFRSKEESWLLLEAEAKTVVTLTGCTGSAA